MGKTFFFFFFSLKGLIITGDKSTVKVNEYLTKEDFQIIALVLVNLIGG